MVTISECLANDGAEAMPEFLADSFLDKASANEICRAFLASRVVFYPGSGLDGGPIKVANRAHAAHCYVYADFQPRTLVEAGLRDEPVSGYALARKVELSVRDLMSGGWESHLASPPPRFHDKNPYGFIAVFQRDQFFRDAHGAERFAILFLGTDGIAAYDALFCQQNSAAAPFCIVLKDHGFGGNWTTFGAGGALMQIAQTADVWPEYLICPPPDGNTTVWPDYRDCGCAAEPMGMHHDDRILYRRQQNAHSKGVGIGAR